MRGFLIFGVALLVAGVAYAWSTSPDGAAGSCTSVSPSGPRVCHYNFSDTTDSGIISTALCRDFNVFLNPDEDGTNTGAEVYIYRCSEPVASTSECHKILGDTDGDGVRDDVTLNGSSMRTGLQNVQAAWIYVDVTANGGSDDARVTIECH
jgi:hypothetical protein